MPKLILHHFDYSPFAEKARLLLGFKHLSWSSVQIPMVMPKPELMPLTGGYRKTPVLQIGADIYCDTRLICRELERRFPSPTLFPGGNRGMALALSHWSDTALFEPGAGLSMAMTTQVPEEVLADRREFFTFMDFSALAGEVPHLSTQLRANAYLIEEQLADGRPYLFGEAVRLGGHHQLLSAVDGAHLRAIGRTAAGRPRPHPCLGGAHARHRAWRAHRHRRGRGAGDRASRRSGGGARGRSPIHWHWRPGTW